MLQRSRWYELTRDSKRKFGYKVSCLFCSVAFCVLSLTVLAAAQTHGGWVRLRVQVNMEYQVDSMLASLGTPMRVLPFRVNVGDLILFDCSSATGKLISAVTNNKWDHVGIVVTLGKHGSLFLMEATTVGT